MQSQLHLLKKILKTHEYKGPFAYRDSKNGPQEQMHLACVHCDWKSSPELRYFSEDVNNKGIKRYYLMTPEALKKLKFYYATQSMNVCFYEMMPSSKCVSQSKACQKMLKAFGTRAYLDCEFPTPTDWIDYTTSQEEPHTLGETISNLFCAYLETKLGCQTRPIILKSHREGKYSWHIIIDTTRNGKQILFRDSLAVFTIIKSWFNEEKKHLEKYLYMKEGTDDPISVIDSSVYATHKLYRTLHSHKFGKSTGPLVWESEKTSFEDSLVIQPWKKDTLIFDVESAKSSTKIFDDVVEPTKKKRCTVVTRNQSAPNYQRNNYNVQLFFDNLDIWRNEVRPFVCLKFPLVDWFQLQYKNIFKVYVPMLDHRCPVKNGSGADGEHKGNFSCLFIFPQVGLIRWQCQKKECRMRSDKGIKNIFFPEKLKQELKLMYNFKHKITL